MKALNIINRSFAGTEIKKQNPEVCIAGTTGYYGANVVRFIYICKCIRFLDIFQFVAVNVLRTIEYLHNLSIDIVSLTGNQVARRACISIETFVHPQPIAHRAITQKQIEIHPDFLNRIDEFSKKL